jgi:cytochrome c-type biogenesis protein CcmE
VSPRFVLLTAFGVLMYTTLGESMQYYKYVDEVVAQPATWKDKNLQVHGHVVPGSIGRKRDSLDYRFEIQRNGQKLTAFYTGVVPDTFKDDSEVVLTGRLTSEGFKATDMTAKCPSKYEAAGPPLTTAPEVEAPTWHPWATTSCWQHLSSALTRPRFQWVGPGAARGR